MSVDTNGKLLIDTKALIDTIAQMLIDTKALIDTIGYSDMGYSVTLVTVTGFLVKKDLIRLKIIRKGCFLNFLAKHKVTEIDMTCPEKIPSL